jgi:hypothetical protein
LRLAPLTLVRIFVLDNDSCVPPRVETAGN